MRHLSRYLFLCYLYFVLFCYFCHGKKSYKGYHLITTENRDLKHHILLRELQAKYNDEMTILSEPSFRSGNTTFLISGSLYQHQIKRELERYGMSPSVLDADIGRRVNYGKRDTSRMETRSESVINLNEFNRFDTITTYLESLRDNHPLCSLHEIGDTFEGRKMSVLKISDGVPDKPAIWIDAGIHAREWIAPATALWIIDKLLNEYDTDGSAKSMLLSFDWYFLPVANPDGYEYTWTDDRLWRKTRSVIPGTSCRGVDPNRNWDYQWAGEGTSDYPCSEIYTGPEPFSEPETKHMSDFMLNELGSNMQVYISLHAYGQLWLYPWGYEAAVPDNEAELAAVARVATGAIEHFSSFHYQYGGSAELLYPAAGASDDWAMAIGGARFAYTVELSPPLNYYDGFILADDKIDDVGDGVWEGMKGMAKVTRHILRGKDVRSN